MSDLTESDEFDEVTKMNIVDHIVAEAAFKDQMTAAMRRSTNPGRVEWGQLEHLTSESEAKTKFALIDRSSQCLADSPVRL